jgi:polar amino acid transport system substrate-binding protein
VGRDETGSPRGIVVDLANELAQRLGVSIEFVRYESAGRMADGAKAGEWDVAFLAIDPARAEEIRFTAPYLEVDTTYLVRNESRIGSIDEVDREGVRISVSNKSAYDLFLTRTLQHAELVRASTPGASIHLFFAENLDALAGLRPLLMDVVESHAGLRLLDGSFMTVRQAMGVPNKGGIEISVLEQFVKEIKASGFVAEIIRKNGVRGAVVAR